MVAKVTLVGNLGVDPEVRYTADGKPVVTCRVASNYRRRDAESREWVDATNWYRVSTFGRLAERMSEQAGDGRLAKGTRVIIFGRLEASAYMDRNNQPQPSLDVVADDVLLADTRGSRDMDEGGMAQTRGPRPVAAAAQPPEDAGDLEDLPF